MKEILIKIGAGGVLLGSVFALVLLSKVDAGQYLGLVGVALAALGIAVPAKTPAQPPAAAPAPTTESK